MVKFNPPLCSSSSVTVSSTFIPGSRLQLYATLSKDEYASICQEGTQVQVWSNLRAAGEWAETPFEEETDVSVEHVDFDLFLDEPLDMTLSGAGDTVTLVATAPLPPLMGRTVQFTYRLLHASGAISWLGSEGTNGSIFIQASTQEPCLKAEDWSKDSEGVFSWKAPPGGSPVVIAKLGGDVSWRGWGIGNEGPSRFTALSSAVTEKVALALLPRIHAKEAYVTYKPVLYHTTGSSTLSLTDDGDILFHMVDGAPVLHASISAPTWKDSLIDVTKPLDVQPPCFLAFCKETQATGRVQFFPTSGFPAVVALRSADAKAIFPYSSDVAFFPPSYPAKFLTASSHESLHIAVGPAGGDVLVSPVYSLTANGSEWKMAFYPHRSGSFRALHTAVEPSSSSENAVSQSVHGEDTTTESRASIIETGAKLHSPEYLLGELLWIVTNVVRLLLQILGGGSIASLAPSPANTSERTPLLADVQEDHVVTQIESSPRLMFEVSGKYTLVMKGEDISQIHINVNGTPWNTALENIEGKYWMFEHDTTDGVHLEVTLHT